ncbi:active regulator of SIRT1 isoform X1 [Leopardus geoffroyi]|uniref:active regulator of SIRT1 isoform X1 n=1 Tax=Leopardus geoffroyi TaxID=46844 RepID=UPI001E261508|nr:active regulator of SIRT1 isoform X1 [Leopardus geoffroyi]
MSAALLRRGLELLGAPEAPQAAPGQAKPSGAPVKRTRKAKATQAQKLRNSAKGKVPKSALAEFRKRECQSYLGVNLKFMTSARSTVAESVTQQVCQGGGPWGGTWAAGRAVGVPARSAEQSRAAGRLGPALLPCFPRGPQFAPL